MENMDTRLQRSDAGLVLVVPPNRIDVAEVRRYVLGYFVSLCGLAILAPHLGLWDLPARLLLAALGLVCGYMFSKLAVHNPIVPTRFFFMTDGRLLVTKPSGKELWSGRARDTSIELRRKPPSGPGRFEWKCAPMVVAADLCEEDFEALREHGLPFVPKGSPALRTRFTRSEQRWWWFWFAVWSVPWWGVVYRGLSMLPMAK